MKGPVLALDSSTLGGSVAVERAFGVPGLGTALVMAFSQRDWMVIQNLVLLYGIVFTFVDIHPLTGA